MTVFEDLEQTAYSENIEILEQYIKNENLKGLYCDNTILLNNRLDSNIKNEVLAHELGHHFTLEDNSILMINKYMNYLLIIGVIEKYSLLKN